MATLVDGYSESNRNAGVGVRAGSILEVTQSFTGNESVLDSAKFFLMKIGSPTGSAVAKVYAHSGTYGTSSVGGGTLLATSDSVDVSTITTSYTLVEFLFSGDNRIILAGTVNYIISFCFEGGSGSDLIYIAYDSTSPTHGGNYSYKFYTGTWYVNSGYDLVFYVYGTPEKRPNTPSVTVGINNPTLLFSGTVEKEPNAPSITVGVNSPSLSLSGTLTHTPNAPGITIGVNNPTVSFSGTYSLTPNAVEISIGTNDPRARATDAQGYTKQSRAIGEWDKVIRYNEGGYEETALDTNTTPTGWDSREKPASDWDILDKDKNEIYTN